MLHLFFKIIRKLSSLFFSISRLLKISQWKTLYPVRFAAGTQLHFGKLFAIHFDASASGIRIGAGVQFRNFCQIRSGTNGKLTIGDRVFFNDFCSIHCFHEIVIGNNCQFGEGVKFYDVNHSYEQKNVLISEQGYNKGIIHIGSNCWFGTNVIILKNVTVGDNVVIGANCIIHQSIPANSVVTNTQNFKIKPSN